MSSGLSSKRWNEFEAKSNAIIIEDQRKQQLISFVLPGFHKKLFNAVFLSCPKREKQYAKHLKKKYKLVDLFQQITFSHQCLQATYSFGDSNVQLASQIPSGLPITRCDQFVTFFCETHGLLKPHNLCYHFFLLFSFCIDTSPTTNDLCPLLSHNFSETSRYIKFGKEVYFDKKYHGIPETFRCVTMLNDTHRSVGIFSKHQSECYIYIFFYFMDIFNKESKCNNCKPKWDQEKMKFKHSCNCTYKLINPFKECNNNLVKGWDIITARNMLLVSCTVGLHISWTELARICGFNDSHTVGKYVMFFASVCEIYHEVHPVIIKNEATHDVAYDGQGKKGKGRSKREIKEHNKTNLSRVMEIPYNIKQGHLRKTQCVKGESVAETAPLLNSALVGQKPLYLDGCGASRSKVIGKAHRVGNCNHKQKEWVRPDTKKLNRLRKVTNNLSENGWVEERLLKRIHRGCGPRTGEYGRFNRQMYQYMRDWIHNNTNRTPEDIAKVFWQHVVEIFQL